MAKTETTPAAPGGIPSAGPAASAGPADPRSYVRRRIAAQDALKEAKRPGSSKAIVKP